MSPALPPVPRHVTLLAEELRRRKEKNPRYSLRAFAAFLKLDPAALSRILNAKQEISIKSAAVAMKKLDLTPSARRTFIASVAEDKMNRAYALLANALSNTEPHEDGGKPREKWSDLARGDALRADSILALNPDWMTITDAEGRILFCNENFARSLGIMPCEAVGSRYGEIGLDADVANAMQAVDRAIVETGEERTLSVKWTDRTDGPPVPRALERFSKPVRLASGEIVGVFSLYRR